jgi:acyl-CoA synthetase (AMP-forming)/AMP-acid ligase II/acyl carrier protein
VRQNVDLWGVLEEQVSRRGDRVAFSYLSFGVPTTDGRDNRTEESITYRQLRDWAVSYAAMLEGLPQTPRAVLLLHRSGLDFVAALMGAIRAGIPAVPAPPPRKPYARTVPRLAAIVEDAGISVVTATPSVRAEEICRLSSPLSTAIWLEAGRRPEPLPQGGDAGASDAAPIAPHTTAYLQYTSGSTASPKGVQVTHANILEQVAALDERFRHETDSTMVNWLPVFHDMGLIYGVLTPIVLGVHSVLMSPEDFAARPIRWLRTVTDYGGTHSMLPNFGFDLCVRKVPEALRVGLDLSSLKVAADASEPVRAETVRAFGRAYRPYGLAPTAHRPAYGLAEATLIVTGGKPDARPGWLPVDRKSLGNGRFTESGGGADAWDVVSCGPPLTGFDVRIVDPDTYKQTPERTEGEVWVAGPCVAAGYHRRPEATAETFQGRMVDDELERDYLRTGDLGFLERGELYVTGRRKDIIIVRGQNYYPQDIEQVAETGHSSLRPGCGAAIALDRFDDRIVLVYEVRDDVPDERLTEVAAGARRAVTETFGISIDTVALLRPGTVPKTSSGKIQRSECGRRFVAGSLDCRRIFEADTPKSAALSPALLKPVLRVAVARLLGVTASDIDDHAPLADYGLDSARAEELAALCSQLLQCTVPDSLAYDYPTVHAMATALTEIADHDG